MRRAHWATTLRREADVVADICDYLTVRHIPFIRTHGPRNKPLHPGTPDIIGCLPTSGRLFQIECKGPNGTVSAEQQDVMAQFHRAGAMVIVARSLEDVIRAGI